MSINKIRTKLQKELEFNPFNKKFNANIVLDFLDVYSKKSNLTYEEKTLITSCLATTTLNSIYDEMYAYLKKNISSSNLSIYEILCFTIILTNRSYILIKSKYNEQLSSQAELHYLDSFKFNIESVDKSIGKINAIAAIEGEVDGLNLFLSYLRFFDENFIPNKTNLKSELESVDLIINASIASSILSLLKNSYEDAIWNRGFLFQNKKDNSINIDYHTHDEKILLQTGIISTYN